MILPDYVTQCLNILEEAGFSAYVVGGCVRDFCLNLTPHDFDICTSALPEDTNRVFSGVFDSAKPLLNGAKHGTVGVKTPFGVVEITTYRREGGYGDNRHPDWVDFVPEVTQDLARRDFTVNAMAYSPRRGFADPFGGRQDLEARVLRAVGDPVQRFREDSLRILRGVRFAVRFGLTVEEGTMAAMVSEAPLMENLARERVFEELCKLIPLMGTADMAVFAPVLGAVIPELSPLVGFDQHSPHHAYDLYTHVAHVVAGVPGDLTLRWAALLHDVGKIPTFTLDETGRGHFYGHAPKGAEMADGILRRLKAPTALRERVVLLIEKHMLYLTPDYLRPDKKHLRRQISRLGWETVEQLLCLQEADMSSKGTGEPDPGAGFAAVRAVLEEIRQEDACLGLKDLAVKGQDLMALGFRGRAIGQALNALLEQVLEEALPNERGALVEYARSLDGSACGQG